MSKFSQITTKNDLINNLSFRSNFLKQPQNKKELDKTIDDIATIVADDIPKRQKRQELTRTSERDHIVKGHSINNILIGHSGNDILIGHSGDDILIGHSGDDILRGGSGNDVLRGGLGNDLLVYNISENHNMKDMYDGGSHTDILRLEMTSSEYQQYGTELNLFRNWLMTTNQLGANKNQEYTFHNFDLTVKNIEKLQVMIIDTTGNWNVRMIKTQGGTGAGANGLNSVTEALELFKVADSTGVATTDYGTYNITTFIDSKADVIDFAGVKGYFNVNNPYPDGSFNTDDFSAENSNFLISAQANILFKAGDYTIAFASDDGGQLSLTNAKNGSAINFINEYATKGDLALGDNKITYNDPRAFMSGATFGTFTLTKDTLVNVNSLFFEQKEGDGFEISIAQGNHDSFNTNDFSLLSDHNFSVPNTYLPFNPDQVFNLNSNPSADHTIYLDFNGHITTGTLWNQAYHQDPIITPIFDRDGNPSTFSNSEREVIWKIWQQVAEDFSPFNVNVTTAQPTLDQLIKSGDSDTQWGTRIVIGGEVNDLEGNPVGGYSYIGSFNWNSDTPAFIRTYGYYNDQLEYYTPQDIADIATHEIGHTLGLGHNQPATEKLNIITTQNGFSFRPDDHPNNYCQADPLLGNGNTTYGIIETPSDSDWFTFSTTTGNIQLEINPFPISPNLDIEAVLYNCHHQIIGQSNPLNSSSANFNLSIDPGQYFLSVRGIGQGELIVGYNFYGSLGQYSIQETII